MTEKELSTAGNTNELEVFEFHSKLMKHFRSREKTWNWFSNKEVKESQKKETKSALLRNTLRLNPEDYAELYTDCNAVCKELAIDAKVTLYQENNSIQANTSVCIIDDEAHIVFSGNVLSILNELEKKALIGHELGHYLFNKMDGEAYETTERIINALSGDIRSDDVYIETHRKFRLFLELFCDSCALKVTSDYKAMVGMLLKLETGLTEVSVDSYLKQALEIIEEDASRSDETSHPESYIRCLYVAKKGSFQTDYESTEILKLITGPLNMNSLDLFQQAELKTITKEVLLLVFQPGWMKTEAIMNLACEYFPDITAAEAALTIEELKEKLKDVHLNVKNYLSYVLLDFSQVDDEMDVLPLGHTLEISEVLGFTAVYEKVVKKELKLNQKEFKKLNAKILEEFKAVREDQSQSLHKG